jgi:hypothetical protein
MPVGVVELSETMEHRPVDQEERVKPEKFRVEAKNFSILSLNY